MKRTGRHKAFTLVEVLVVSGMMTLLASLLAASWVGLGRPMASVIAHARLVQEIDLAAAALARDLGGSLANPEGRLGGKQQAAFVGWMPRAGGQLWLCFDGGSPPDGAADWAPPDTVIVYLVDDHTLVRWDQSTSTSFPVAQCVDTMILDLSDDELRIELTFKHRGLKRSCVFLARAP